MALLGGLLGACLVVGLVCLFCGFGWFVGLVLLCVMLVGILVAHRWACGRAQPGVHTYVFVHDAT